MTWTQYDKLVNATGTYIAYGTPGQSEIWIQSRKLHIPHANGSGTWDHTTFAVLRGNDVLIEKQTLRAAKEYAEKLIEEGKA